MTTPTDLATFDPRATYGRGARDYDQASRNYWSFASVRTINRLALPIGVHVLDVACGPGWSALHAAEHVGPGGRVVAVDYAKQMLRVARVKAEQRGLKNIAFHLGDMTVLDFADECFDAVVCVFGVFFAEDMVGQLRELWRCVRPGGQLAITTIGPCFFQPLFDIWKIAVREERPDARLRFPWERTERPDAVRALMLQAGISGAEAALEHEQLRLRSEEDWWHIVMGTGLRRTVEEIGPEAAARVQGHNTMWAVQHEISSIELSVIYACAVKPS